MQKPQIGQIGVGVLSTMTLFDGAVLNPELTAITEYERMLTTDETVAAGIKYITTAVLSRLGEYHHDNPKIKEFVEENLNDVIEGNFLGACEELLSALWAGFSTGELVIKPEGGRYWLERLAVYHPKSIQFRIDRHGQLLDNGIVQNTPLGLYDIPTQQAVILTHNKRFGNIFGHSILKPARKNWLLKDPILKMWALALDRFGTPLAVFFVPRGKVLDPSTGEQKDAVEVATQAVSNIQSGTGLVFQAGNDEDGKADAKVIAAGGTGTDAFYNAVTYLNKMILRAMMVPSLVFDEGARSGSHALGQGHAETFERVIEGIFIELTEALLDQVIGRLLMWNFGEKDKGEFLPKAPSTEERKLMAEMFMEMVNTGALSPAREEDFKYMRSNLGLPEAELLSPLSNDIASLYKNEQGPPEKTERGKVDHGNRSDRNLPSTA